MRSACLETGTPEGLIGRLRAQGRTVREIAEQLGYSRSLVHKTLANRGSDRVANVAD
jgi:IS30 family transposase